MKQMDVTAAYLHGNIKENIYVTEGPLKEMIKPGDEEKVWKLKRSMYGLKQSRQAWNGRLNDTLTKLSFRRLQADCCIYIKEIKSI